MMTSSNANATRERGPATVARYGTDAAGGVIYVVTRQAVSDPSRFRAYVEGGATRDATDYPANYGNAQSCTQARAALGQCVAGPVRTWNPLKAVSPFRSAPHAVAGARVTVLATPQWSLGASGTGVVNDGVLRSNDHRQYSGSVNGGFRRDSTFAVRSNVWVIGGHTRLPMIGSSVLGVLGAGLMGRSVDDPELEQYQDDYETKLQQLVEAKIAGKEIVEEPADAETPQVINLMETLQRSIAQAKRPAGAKPPKMAAPGTAGKTKEARKRKTS